MTVGEYYIEGMLKVLESPLEEGARTFSKRSNIKHVFFKCLNGSHESIFSLDINCKAITSSKDDWADWMRGITVLESPQKRAYIQIFGLVNKLEEDFSFNNIARDNGPRIVKPCTNLLIQGSP
ncbi:hypothetical protein QVD17_20145 [Tagetes erecta]|uniref:Uncharacterized protein n=1 Tax=Tagetes erecta TaxID=13708 RepID=A0AAD8KL04_TARER|nr:hypothetical protein QVD17_20145 [Tagetes erecta]